MYRLLKDAIVFSSEGKYGNLSRMDPALVTTGLNGRTDFRSVRAGGSPKLFTSVGETGECHLEEPKMTGVQRLQRILSVSILAGEYERFVGAVGMISNLHIFAAQMKADYLDFTSAMDFSKPGQFHICLHWL